MFPILRFCPRWLVVLTAGGGAILFGATTGQGQTRPVRIDAGQATAAPYRDSGRLYVLVGPEPHTGTATAIRRSTGVTAAHMLYDQQEGFSTDVTYAPGLYEVPAATVHALYLGVSAGYQTAAKADALSENSFAQDVGWLLFDQPAAGNSWAAWSQNPAALQGAGTFLALGYVGASLTPNVIAQVATTTPFTLAQAPGLYENESFVSEPGMSGGPVYAPDGAGGSGVAAVDVGESTGPTRTFTSVRVITAADARWFTEAEYVHGLVTGGVISGPANVLAGKMVKYKTAVVFADGVEEGNNWAARYDEAVLTVAGPNKKRVRVTRIKRGRFAVQFGADLPGGTRVELRLVRNTAKPGTQTPLQTCTVTAQ